MFYKMECNLEIENKTFTAPIPSRLKKRNVIIETAKLLRLFIAE